MVQAILPWGRINVTWDKSDSLGFGEIAHPVLHIVKKGYGRLNAFLFS
jgi:hypothetical protein